jgi:hypothetical protein
MRQPLAIANAQSAGSRAIRCTPGHVLAAAIHCGAQEIVAKSGERESHRVACDHAVTYSEIVPDFHIGAHAAVSGCAILTRDVSRYRSYFPTVSLIAHRNRRWSVRPSVSNRDALAMNTI